jgi:putative flippase GtrA
VLYTSTMRTGLTSPRPLDRSDDSDGPDHGSHPAPQSRSVLVQYIHFCIVGLSNAVVDLGVLNLLLLLHPTQSVWVLLLYNTLAVSLAILNSYIWNIRWTFRGVARKTPRERILFVAQALLNIATNNLVLLAMTGILTPLADDVSSYLISNAAKLAAMVVASSTSFLILRTIVFRPRNGNGGHPASEADAPSMPSASPSAPRRQQTR